MSEKTKCAEILRCKLYNSYNWGLFWFRCWSFILLNHLIKQLSVNEDKGCLSDSQLNRQHLSLCSLLIGSRAAHGGTHPCAARETQTWRHLWQLWQLFPHLPACKKRRKKNKPWERNSLKMSCKTPYGWPWLMWEWFSPANAPLPYQDIFLHWQHYTLHKIQIS